MGDDFSEFQKKLQELWEVYSAQLPRKLEEIERRWKALQAGNWSSSELQEFHRLVHGIAGSAGTFGYTQLGEKARLLEQAIKPMVKAGESGQTSLLAHLEPSVDALASAGSFALPGQSCEYTPPPDTGLADGTDYEESECLIYVVEDDTELAREIELQLISFGYGVRLFSDLTDMQAAVRKRPPEAILMDVIFPEGPEAGIEAVREIRERVGLAIPALFISVRDDFQARLAAVRAGGDGYFCKPLNIDAVADRLASLICRRAQNPYRILIVDDERALAEHYALILRGAGMEVETLDRPSDVLERLREFSPHLILMDLYMPECSGIELAAIIRQQDQLVGVPIVFLSTETNIEMQFRARDLGGDDFILKPIRSDHLICAVLTRARRSRSLRAAIYHDSLTGLLNHVRIKEQLDIELSRCQRQGTPLTLAMIDLDHFKAVNDEHGHPAGDQVIRSISNMLKRRLRKTDLIGRYGGEEFVVIMSDTALDEALSVLEEIRTGFAQIRHRAEGTTFTVTLSGGLCCTDHDLTAAELMKSADDALYNAKRLGRNRILAASPNPTDGTTPSGPR
jgi:diguanylate cyclase (GGDEF)-like protein